MTTKTRQLATTFGWLASCVLALFASTAIASAESPPLPQKLPGEVDFGRLQGLSEKDASVEIYLRGPLIRMVSEATRRKDPEFAELLARLDVVRVEIFPLKHRDSHHVFNHVESVATQLQSRGWIKAARIRDEDKNVYIHLKTRGEAIAGLVVMVVSNDRFVFVNLVGDVDPANIGRIGGGFDIEELEELKLKDVLEDGLAG